MTQLESKFRSLTSNLTKLDIYILWDLLVCSVAEYFNELCRRNTQRYYTPIRLISYLLSNHFFFCWVFLFISHKAGKAERIEKRSARSWLIKQVFLQYKITNCSNNRRISQDIFTLFARYLYSILCSWMTNLIFCLCLDGCCTNMNLLM